jgi:hypothetical protein
VRLENKSSQTGTMKSVALLFSAAFTLLCATSNAQSIEKEIAAIRQTYARINSLKLQPEKFTYEAEGCVEEGTVTYYRSNKEIVKIGESGSIGDGSWKNEYYYQSGKLVFVLESLVGGPAAGPATKSEYRYYFKDDKSIRFMEGQKVITENSSKIGETLQHGYGYFRAYETRAFAGVACE